MNSQHLTRSASNLQHALDGLLRAYDGHEDFDSLVARLHDFRHSLLLQAEVVTGLVDKALEVPGTYEEISTLPRLARLLLRSSHEMSVDLEVRHERPDPQTVTMLVIMVDELLLDERRLICRCGAMMFPAETWN